MQMLAREMAPAVLLNTPRPGPRRVNFMASTESSASTAHPSTLKLSARLQRGINLAEERFEEITRTAPYIWTVPSCSGEHTYTVDLKAKTCSCQDRPPAPERCKHYSAAAYKKAKTATCSGCGDRVRHRELLEVQEDHDSLTFFVGDLVCHECASAHGVL